MRSSEVDDKDLTNLRRSEEGDTELKMAEKDAFPQPPAPNVLRYPTMAAPPQDIYFGQNSIKTQCHNCQREVQTVVEGRAGAGAWISAACLCLIGGWLCFWVPFCTDDCKNFSHFCPLCGQLMGEKSTIRDET